MDPKFQTSFIPKRPVVQSGLGASVSRSRNILGTIGVGFFAITVLLSAGAFLYEKKLDRDNEARKAQVEQEIASFDPALTKSLSALKSRMDSASELLQNHLALSMFFELLGRSTVSTVQFKDFSFKGGPGKALSVNLSGFAQSYNDLVFQSDTMLASTFMKNQKFSDFGLDADGRVTFRFSADIDPSYVSYQKALDALSAPSTQSIPASTVSGDETTTASSTTTS